MDEDFERRETLTRKSNGDLKMWAEFCGIFFTILGIILFITGIIVGGCAIADKYEIKAFNKIHGTDYTFGEWFWAQDTIKDYHLGTVENKNYQVDLNVNDDRVEGGE